MRVMVLVKATEDSEKGTLPAAEMFEAMGRFNDELVNAGIMRAGDGLKPSSHGKRIAFEAGVSKDVEREEAVFHWVVSRGWSKRENQMRSSWTTVLSFVMFPVLSVDFGSIKTRCTSSSATGQCSTPRGTDRKSVV